MAEQQTNKIAGVVDFVICLDITGSMSDCIENLKTSLKSFVDGLTSPVDLEGQNTTFKVTEWSGRLLPFRDIDKDPEGEQIFDDFPFVGNAEALRKQIDDPRVKADFGDDEEESSLDALYIAASKSPWPSGRKSNKFVILFTDAPPRAELSEKTINAGPRDSGEVAQKLRGMHVVPILFARKHSAFDPIMSVAQDRNAHEVSRFFDSFPEAEAFFKSSEKFEVLMDQLGRSVSQSASEEL